MIPLRFEYHPTYSLDNEGIAFRNETDFPISINLEYSTDNVNWNTWDGSKLMYKDSTVYYIRGIDNYVVTGSKQVDYHFMVEAKLLEM